MKAFFNRVCLVWFVNFLFFQCSYGQSKFSIGLVFSPQYSYRALHAKSDCVSCEDLIFIRDTMEKAKFGYSAGYNFGYQIKERISISFGISFSDKGEKQMCAVAYYDTLPFYVITPIYHEVVYKYKFLDFPVEINYKFPLKNFNLIMLICVSPNFFLSKNAIFKPKLYREKLFLDSVTKDKNLDFNPVNFSVIVGVGLEYVNKKMSFGVYPKFNRDLTPSALLFDKIKQCQYSLGFENNIKYFF